MALAPTGHAPTGHALCPTGSHSCIFVAHIVSIQTYPFIQDQEEADVGNEGGPQDVSESNVTHEVQNQNCIKVIDHIVRQEQCLHLLMHRIALQVELVRGIQAESVWVILDCQYIMLPSGVYTELGVPGRMHHWECRFRREKNTKCPVKLVTKENGEVGVQSDLDRLHVVERVSGEHTCHQDVTHILDHKFRTKIKKLAETDFKFRYVETFTREKKNLLASISDKALKEQLRNILPTQEEFREVII